MNPAASSECPPPAQLAPGPGGKADALFVDLDGTLLKSDLLHEALLLSLRTPRAALRHCWTGCTRGRAALKQSLAESLTPDPRRLPLRAEVVQFLAERRAAGQKIVLATASDAQWARRIAEEVGLFDDVLASDGRRNLKGPAKLEAIAAYCQTQGFAGFDYLGDSQADLPIWRAARHAYLAAPSPRTLKAVEQFRQPAAVLGQRPARLLAVLRVLRVRHWLKNLLVFVPLLVAHRLLDAAGILNACLAFLAFCACSSAVYIVNDLLDIEADRLHPQKRNRPFAAGDLPVLFGFPLAGLLLAAAFGIALALPWLFAAVLALYLLTSSAYSFWIKRLVLVDAFTLAGLYTLRLLAGGAATNILVSEWLMGFSVFFFLSLAFAKRYAELDRLAQENEKGASGRGYRVDDISLIEVIGPTCGCLAVLVFALYIHSQEMKLLYSNKWPLWLICPLLLYWITRLWLMAKRRALTEDPVVYAVKDWVSLCAALLVLLLLALATVLPAGH